MLTYQSKLLGKARKEAPSDAVAPSHKLLARAGYINQLASGIFSLLPLGRAVQQKIEDSIRSEMGEIGAQELLLPALHPAALWAESGRLDTIDPPLFRTKDRHKKELVLASTHEEVITDLARTYIDSYKDLPFAVFQIQTKFRNEVRPTSGLVRVREFQMKDLYSFHQTEEDLRSYYERVKQAYLAIFKRCDLKVLTVEADPGSIGGSMSHEFSTEAEAGEDKVAVCPECGFAINVEVQAAQKGVCPKCGAKLEIKACIENGHIFQLGTKYSRAMGALFTDREGNKQPIVMGCYGIGVGRLLAAIVETHHDEKGIGWPPSVAPFDIHVLALQESVLPNAEKYSAQLSKSAAVLFDDRPVSAGQKFAESDLIGIPQRVIISEKTQDAGTVEVVQRKDGSSASYDPKEFLALWD